MSFLLPLIAVPAEHRCTEYYSAPDAILLWNTYEYLRIAAYNFPMERRVKVRFMYKADESAKRLRLHINDETTEIAIVKDGYWHRFEKRVTLRKGYNRFLLSNAGLFYVDDVQIEDLETP